MKLIKARGLHIKKEKDQLTLLFNKMYNSQNPNNNNFPIYPQPPVEEIPPVNDNFLDGPIPDTAFGDSPVFIVCPNCNYRGNTRVDRARGCVSFWCTYFYCISLCTECCDDYQHVCPQCKVVLETYQII
jgi:hypothetical protein